MKVKCEYCNNLVDDGELKCPNCGAENVNYKRVGVDVPTTIEELKKWYVEHNLPSYDQTRFYIGIDYKLPRAFGIYKDEVTGKFVVYKNKDTGERAIRYEGTDEKYAVNELYLKLKEEIAKQKIIAMNARHTVTSFDEPKRNNSVNYLILLIAVFGAIFSLYFIFSPGEPERGYYSINNHEYYYVNGKWYIYSRGNWTSTSKPDYSGSVSKYYDSYSYHGSDDYSDIKNSDVYSSTWDSRGSSSSSSHSSRDDDRWDNDSWDSDSSWDSSDSWDSSSTDWGSDW